MARSRPSAALRSLQVSIGVGVRLHHSHNNGAVAVAVAFTVVSIGASAVQRSSGIVRPRKMNWFDCLDATANCLYSSSSFSVGQLWRIVCAARLFYLPTLANKNHSHCSTPRHLHVPPPPPRLAIRRKKISDDTIAFLTLKSQQPK